MLIESNNVRIHRTTHIVMQRNNTYIALLVMGIISFIGILAFRNTETVSSILYATCLALFISFIFYVLTVIVPEAKKRKRIRKGLAKQYRSFKRRCIHLFLISAKSQNYRDHDNLLNHYEFRRYFSIEGANGQSRWDLVATSIDNQDYIFEEIVRELDFFSREVEFARSSIDIDDEKVEDFLIRFGHVVHTIKAAEANSDDYKHFCRTLWSIFTRCNFVDGQLEEDIIESMIKKI